MFCRCCRTTHTQSALPLILMVALCVSLASGLGSLIGGIGDLIAMPDDIWLPVTAFGVGGTVWGLWMGYRTHGRGEPLTVGIFGLLVAGGGLLFSQILTLTGVGIALSAALWSTLSSRAGNPDRHEADLIG